MQSRAYKAAKSRRYYWKNRDKQLELAKSRNQRRRYGICQSYLEWLGDFCFICGAKRGNSKGHRLSVDHCHKTDTVRGLLCRSCNTGLGCFKDNPALLRKAAEYLDRFKV